LTSTGASINRAARASAMVTTAAPYGSSRLPHDLSDSGERIRFSGFA
jgi:hypothetical protein